MQNELFDLRQTKIIDLDTSICLKENVTYQFQDILTGKQLVAKFIGYYSDEEDEYLIKEFKKLILLSGEPEIGTVHFLATGQFATEKRSCYVMNFIKGETLGSFIKNNEVISHEVIVDILVQITGGLEKAHNYEIFHSDLHDENIIIDWMGYVKIIDFAWYDYKMQGTFNFEKDIECFKEIVTGLFKKNDNKEIELVKSICLNAKNFKGLKKKILEISDAAIDMGMLSENSKSIISVLIRDLTQHFNFYKKIGRTNNDIPENLLPALNEDEITYNSSENTGMFKLLNEGRIIRIEAIVKNMFNLKLQGLKQAGLITDWSLYVENTSDNSFTEPYKMTYFLYISRKFIDWKILSEKFDFFLPSEESKFSDLIFNSIL